MHQTSRTIRESFCGALLAAGAMTVAAQATPSAAQSPAAPSAPQSPPAPSPSGAQSAAAPQSPPAARCASAEARQFDFWLGDWALTWKQPDGSTAQGTNRVESMFGGCVVQENFEGPGPQPFVGKSWSVWSPQRKKWQQTWVDNGGGYFDLTGEFADGRMVLVRDGILGNGKPGKQRMVYSNITKDELDWNWETSEDGGQTWVTRWRIHYRRK